MNKHIEQMMADFEAYCKSNLIDREPKQMTKFASHKICKAHLPTAGRKLVSAVLEKFLNDITTANLNRIFIKAELRELIEQFTDKPKVCDKCGQVIGDE